MNHQRAVRTRLRLFGVAVVGTLVAGAATGAFAATAGAAPAVGAATAKAPTVQICRSTRTPGTFQYRVNNGPKLSVSSTCATVKVRAGRDVVTQTWAPQAYRSISSITVSPRTARVQTSPLKASAVLKVRAGERATVRFTNATVAATGPGYVEVCKYAAPDAGGDYVSGSFNYTVTAGTATQTVSVQTGQCSLPMAVPAGAVKITEAAASPYFLEAVTTDPSIALGSVNLASQSATVTVAANGETTANFVNSTQLNDFKVCKILANNQGNLAGSTFTFTANWTFTPPNGAMIQSGSGTVNVVAVAAPAGACVPFPYALPAGTSVAVTENAFPDVAVTGVQVIPASADNGSTATMASLTVAPTAQGYVDAVFTNEPLGIVEVCKAAADPSTAAMSFQFSVDGGAPFWVHAGDCSPPIPVAAGTATVSEASTPNFYLQNVSTVSATDPMGTRLLSGPTANPATVTVPYGGVGNETMVTFTDAVDQAAFKICKQETSPDANLSGGTFTFDYAYTVDGVQTTGSTQLTIGPSTATNPTGEVCSGVLGTVPAVDANGQPVPIQISEQLTDIPGVEATDIAYAGNGSVVAAVSTPDPVTAGDPGASPAWICIDPGPGMNVVTYTNGRTPPAQSDT